MKRIKKHRIKTEKPETSTSYSRPQEDYDLAYYIHDRVELMHQVFSVLRHKDLKAMAPECVRHISIDELQELCTEELLGISSKRLCAMLDGAEPPSDTESSSASPPACLETISLDSISSDEEILSQGSVRHNRKHKHRHRAKTKKPGKSKDTAEDPEQSRASRAGLTVLELLELQARARAIRAQLQKEQAAKKQSSIAESVPSDHDDIEIKEEPATVVEISSDEEQPKVEPGTETSINAEPDTISDSEAITKRKNNLIITVPKTKQTRKIKLNRSKAVLTVVDNNKVATSSVAIDNPKTITVDEETVQTSEKSQSTLIIKSVTVSKEELTKEKAKKKTKKKEKKKNMDKEGSDHDEITLQLSDTEKMDLLEDLDRKNFDKLSSSSSEDSESSSSDSGSESQEEIIADKPPVKEIVTLSRNKIKKRSENNALVKERDSTSQNKNLEQETLKETKVSDNIQVVEENTEKQDTFTANLKVNEEITDKNDESNKEIDAGNSSNSENTAIVNVSVIDTINITEISSDDVSDKDKSNSCIIDNEDLVAETSFKELLDTSTSQNTVKNVENDRPIVVVINNSENIVVTQKKIVEKETNTVKFLEVSSIEDIPLAATEPLETMKEVTTSEEVIDTLVKEVDGESITTEKIIDLDQSPKDKDTCQLPETSTENTADKDLKQVESQELSDGKISEKASSEIEAFEPQPEVVYISDEDTSKKTQKKKKKKEKKHKKEKKSKKSKKNFREGGDQNFYKDTTKTAIKTKEISGVTATSVHNDDDVYEILELSDDSSCYEVEGTVLSKEPTAEEIEALSAKIDQIEREEVVTEQEIIEHEQREMEKNSNNDDLEQISWKDRYLDSNKVKRVLSTSGIFNALRKKNRELKKKLEESKKKDVVEEVETVEMPVEITIENVEDGSIEQFNALQGSNKYVDPVPEITEKVQDETVATKDGDETKTDELATEITPVTREMKKDAKQLLKMYKRLLKYNDVTKQKDPSKKKKKSKKKSKDAGVASTEISGV